MKTVEPRRSDAKATSADPARKITKITSERIVSVVMDAYEQPKDAWRRAMAGLIRNEGV
jgi:hypothetical protein